ncbi:MAG: molybdopterin-binding protein [Halobacteriales archaeon]|nr:molybdopterin-binding protein [Halobacteriales archaeon]
MRVAIVTVGDELLVGDTVNTNAAWLGEQLTDRGATVERVIVIPDRIGDIATVVNEARATHDAVLVTGGLGPTHDDVTMEGVASALGVEMAPHEDAIDWIENESDYSHADLVDGTTDLPVGARMLPNPEGVAPGAVLTADDGVPVYVLPGVPDEMKAMFALVADEFDGTPRTRRVLYTEEPESALIERFHTVQERFDVTIGSYPGEVVRITVTSGDEAEATAAAEWLIDRVDTVSPPDEAEQPIDTDVDS